MRNYSPHYPPRYLGSSAAILVASTLLGWPCQSAIAQQVAPDLQAAVHEDHAREDHYWELGVGLYFAGCHGRFTELDAARADWLMLRIPGLPATRQTTEALNRLIALNPRLKILARIWPIGGLSQHREGRYQATFYEYFYEPGVKEKLFAEIRRQVRVILDHLDKPENFVALTFLEELPQHFTDMAFANEDGKTTWAMEAYREQIEAETGKPFEWNDEGRRWWGRKYVQAYNEIHAVMKEASEGRTVIYWQQTGYKNLDHYPPGTPLSTSGLVPIRLTDIVKPGLCDGVFAYPNSETVWEDDALRFARERNWLFFSQLAHAPWMRSEPWDITVRRTRTRVPQNLGTVWYCEGNCIHPIYESQRNQTNSDRIDPSIPPDEGGPDMIHYVEHTRRALAQMNVGMDVVRRNLKPELALDYSLGPTGCDPRRIFLQVHNTREPSWYTDPQEATLTGATVTLSTPKGIDLANEESATVALGDIEADGYRVVSWPVRIGKEARVTSNHPLRARMTTDNGPAVEIVSEVEETAIDAFQPRALYRSGDAWVEPTYRLQASGAPQISLRVLQGVAENPTLRVGDESIQYDGTLAAGEKLVLEPGGNARIVASNLVIGDAAVYEDPVGPLGTQGFSEGEEIINRPLMKPARPGSDLKVTISGKATGGAASLVLLWGYQENGWEQWHSEPILADKLSATWQEGVSETIDVPAGADVRRVIAYRRGGRGTIWYGDIRVTLADMPPEGLDVSDKVQGNLSPLPMLPTLAGGRVQKPLRFTYTDDSDPTWYDPRVLVQVRQRAP